MTTTLSSAPSPPPGGALPIYRLRSVTRHHKLGETTVPAVNGIDLDIAEGEMVVIEGASGSGKSTLLQLLGGLDRLSSGALQFEGEDLGSLPDRKLAELRLRAFGFIFQHFNLIPTLTASENVEAALAPAGAGRKANRARAVEVLDQVGLGSRADHLPTQLSGGEQQRVAIARALANHPRVILADEPTGNLDTTTGTQILDLLSDLWRGGQTIVLVTHDPRVSARAPRVLRMQDGRMLDDAATFAPPSAPPAAMPAPHPAWPTVETAAAPVDPHTADADLSDGTATHADGPIAAPPGDLAAN